MNAHLFAQINQLPILITGYRQLKFGPYLRNEKTKRSYYGYFSFEQSHLGEFKDKVRAFIIRKTHFCIYEPKIEVHHKDQLSKKAFIFEKYHTYADSFGCLKDYRNAVKELFYEMLTPTINKFISENSPPVIGVHIRMGDFRKLQNGETYSTGQNVRMPEDYFISIIEEIRRINGQDLPVSVFTDGYKYEFKRLITLNNIKFIEGNPDIVDLVLLSKSQVIIASPTSTFSAWAGFLSDNLYVVHPRDIHKSIRSEEFGEAVFEGTFDLNNKALVNQLKEIRH
jgi:hypothetical protein